MTQQFNSINSGALFKNDKKTSDKSPNQKGQAEVCCPHCGVVTKFWISGWVKVMRNGVDRFISLAFTADDKAVNSKTPTPQTPKDDIDFDDDIPF